MAKDIPDIPNPLINGDYTINRDWSSFHFKEISSTDARNAIGRLKTTKCLGNNKISSFFIKLALTYICDSLAKMFNVSIMNGKFPEAWQIARATPIFKNGETTEISNYKPISVLPILSILLKNLHSTNFIDILIRIVFYHQVNPDSRPSIQLYLHF